MAGPPEAIVVSALPIAAIPVERFVERVLHRAWDERERFATAEALYRHAQNAALSAITRTLNPSKEFARGRARYGQQSANHGASTRMNEFAAAAS